MKFLGICLVLCLFVGARSYEFKGFTLKQFQFLYQLITGDFMDSKKKELVQEANVGNETSSYYDYITYMDAHRCGPHETSDQERLSKRAKCVRAKGNGTLYLMNSVNDVMTLLSPAPGSSRNDQQAGNCVVMLFYARSCLSCQMLVPHYNALARNFPDIKVAALDAFEHPGLNTDFGIIGLPTIALFHNSRMKKFTTLPVETITNFVHFITTNTNLRPNTSKPVVTSDDFSPTSPLRLAMQDDRFDPYLWLSWTFIVLCAAYYFSKSRTYAQIVDMINRTWRESNEAQM